MKITEDEISTLENAKTERDWNAACDAIKAARKGEYPTDWYARVMMSGVLSRAHARFN